MKPDRRLLMLNENDNIFICCEDIKLNDPMVVESELIVPTCDIALGHKIARADIKTDEKIFKYGVSIGSAKMNIKKGEHVHLHNMKSDYISSYTRSGIVNDEINTRG